MKAITHNRYGSPDVLRVADVANPELADDLVLVRVRAASINPADWYGVVPALALRPMMGIVRPRTGRVGIDFAGTVEAVGKEVTHVAPGDDVFGSKNGALAEYLTVKDAVVKKPANVSFEEAAGVGVAAITALQGLRDKAQLQPGEKVLINGASGGVGTYAVQLAKELGAHVTAVCSTGKVELAHSLGADRVVDYTREDFTRGGDRYDVVFDIAGSRRWGHLRRVLEPEGRVIVVGVPKGGRILGPLGRLLRLRLASLRGSQKAVFFIAKTNRADMQYLADLLESGRLRTVVDRTFPLAETPGAFRYLGEGHARGKIVVTL
jgi:NADPH:quinone reductase-like Zn-dependent oxidoreductase